MREALLVIVAALAGGCSTAWAQTGQYFLTIESGPTAVRHVSGGSVVNSYPTQPGGARMGPIIVDGSSNAVRYVEGGLVGGSVGPGAEHTLNGAFVGGLSFDLTSQPAAGRVVDAGFDGQYSYVVAGLFGEAAIYRFGDDFSGGGTKSFGVNQTAQGITCDTATGTIWTTDYDLLGGTGHARQWSLSGELLFSFPVTNASGVNSERSTALAYDSTDDTFWLNACVENTLGQGFGELWQFSRAGHFLQAVNPSPNQNLIYWGGEITPVPAPGVLTLVAVAAGALGAHRRRR